MKYRWKNEKDPVEENSDPLPCGGGGGGEWPVLDYATLIYYVIGLMKGIYFGYESYKDKG